MTPSPMVTDSLLQAVESHAYWAGFVFGTALTGILLLMVFVWLGGRIRWERTNSHSQFGRLG